jgi:hypothetical protein
MRSRGFKTMPVSQSVREEVTIPHQDAENITSKKQVSHRRESRAFDIYIFSAVFLCSRNALFYFYYPRQPVFNTYAWAAVGILLLHVKPIKMTELDCDRLVVRRTCPHNRIVGSCRG